MFRIKINEFIPENVGKFPLEPSDSVVERKMKTESFHEQLSLCNHHFLHFYCVCSSQGNPQRSPLFSTAGGKKRIVEKKIENFLLLFTSEPNEQRAIYAFSKDENKKWWFLLFIDYRDDTQGKHKLDNKRKGENSSDSTLISRLLSASQDIFCPKKNETLYFQQNGIKFLVISLSVP